MISWLSFVLVVVILRLQITVDELFIAHYGKKIANLVVIRLRLPLMWNGRKIFHPWLKDCFFFYFGQPASSSLSSQELCEGINEDDLTKKQTPQYPLA